jgi:myo-inositol-hexaphosphate 3-phosphohydrolase
VEVAFFVPPAGHNPIKPSMRNVLSNKTQVWGVVVDEATGLIYASDMNTGLWILRRTD